MTPRIIYTHQRRRPDWVLRVMLLGTALVALAVAHSINQLAERTAAAHAFEDCRADGHSIETCRGVK